MAVIAKICSVDCSKCGFKKTQHYVHFDKLETFTCPICGGELIPVGSRRGRALHGQFSNDINSDCFVRADKHHPGRDMVWGWNKIQKLADAGRTRPIQDREVKMVKDRMALYARDHGEVKYNGIQ